MTNLTVTQDFSKPFNEMSLMEKRQFHLESRKQILAQEAGEKIRLHKESERIKLKKAKAEYNRLHSNHKLETWFNSQKVGLNLTYKNV